MFIKSLAVCASVITFSGCGKTETAPDANKVNNQQAEPNNLRKQDEQNEDTFVRLTGDDEDRACQRALKDVARARAETFCKDNKGVKYCQWLYIGKDGKVLYDQRADEEIDKSIRSQPLSCEEAGKRYPASA
jgi:hypothetical protein